MAQFQKPSAAVLDKPITSSRVVEIRASPLFVDAVGGTKRIPGSPYFLLGIGAKVVDRHFEDVPRSAVVELSEAVSSAFREETEVDGLATVLLVPLDTVVKVLIPPSNPVLPVRVTVPLDHDSTLSFV